MGSKQSAKGSRLEYKVRDLLTDKTGVKWERVPMSGAGAMKGDVYCLKAHYYHCFECKSYKDSAIQDNLLTAKSNNIYSWWEQAVREAGEMEKIPAIVFKKDRGKLFIGIAELVNGLPHIKISSFGVEIYLYLFEDWLAEKKVSELIHV